MSFSLHRSGFTIAEVEPMGVYQFAPDSLQLVVSEDIQTITLYVQRLYGSRSNTTRLSYKTIAGSAAAGEDFVAVPDGRLVFDSLRQTNTSFHLSILDDSLSEPDESFNINLTDVQVLTPDVALAEVYPRLNPQRSVATVTILASDVTGGVLSIGPGLVQVPEDRNEETQQEQRVVLRVRRSDSVAGNVRVRVQAYGGLCLFCRAALLLHCSILSFVICFVYNTSSTRVAVLFYSDGSTIPLPFTLEPVGTLAKEQQDFRLESTVVSLQAGQNETEVILLILDDSEPEGQEVFFIYLTNPEGGAQITDSHYEGFGAFAKITILGKMMKKISLFVSTVD